MQWIEEGMNGGDYIVTSFVRIPGKEIKAGFWHWARVDGYAGDLCNDRFRLCCMLLLLNFNAALFSIFSLF